MNKNIVTMRILVIEDSPQIRNLLKASLKGEYFVIDMAVDGEEVSYLARTNDYDLIILDIILPKKQGLQVCKEIRESGKKMPILVLSVKSETNTKVELLNAGADDYLVKPFSVKELLARIRALLRRPRQLKGEILKIDDLTLDAKKHMVTRGKKQIYLTPKEFILLEYFMRNRGVVLSRGMILEHVWDMNTDPFSNTIEQHILRLRRKMDTKGKKELIQTVPGVGYIIDI